MTAPRLCPPCAERQHLSCTGCDCKCCTKPMPYIERQPGRFAQFVHQDNPEPETPPMAFR